MALLLFLLDVVSLNGGGGAAAVVVVVSVFVSIYHADVTNGSSSCV